MLCYANKTPPALTKPKSPNHLCKLSRVLPLLTLRQLCKRRPRDRISSVFGKQIKLNPRIRTLIKTRRRHTPTQLHSPTPTNHNIHTLGVRLCTIRLARGVQRDDFVAQDVVPRGEIWDRQVPGEVVLDEVVGDPGTRVGAGFPGALLDFGPGEGGGGDG